MTEFSEFPNLEENDFDINNNYYCNDDNSNNQEPQEEYFIEEDIFEDKNIEETLRRYNYDYKTLTRELTTLIDYSELVTILNECGIRKVDFLNPTYVTFEKLRDRIIHNNSKSI